MGIVRIIESSPAILISEVELASTVPATELPSRRCTVACAAPPLVGAQEAKTRHVRSTPVIHLFPIILAIYYSSPEARNKGARVFACTNLIRRRNGVARARIRAGCRGAEGTGRQSG